MTDVDDEDKLFIKTCQRFNLYVKCYCRSIELFYIYILYSGMIWILHWRDWSRTFNISVYCQDLNATHISDSLKEINSDHKYLRCTDLQDDNFKVMHTNIELDKLDPAYTERELYKKYH